MKHLPYCFLLYCSLYAHRSIHRPHQDLAPYITVWSDAHPKKHTLIDANLRPVPLLKTFDRKHFEENLFPKDSVTFRYEKQVLPEQVLPEQVPPEQSVEAKKINTLINSLMQEIEKKKRLYKDFIILKNSGFIRHKKCGLLIAKFKDYPFILKLFIEPPESFVNPYDKGFEVCNVFVASGSIRHTLGFSRIKTLNYIHEKIKTSTQWKDRIVMPRKWFWLPEKADWLNIEAHNLGENKKDVVRIPSTYAVIADAMEQDPIKQTDNDELMALSQYLEHRVDPHTKNFFIDKHTGKIALIDTELFPLILGFNEKIQKHDTHVKWYIHLAGKYSKEKFFSMKNYRKKRQYNIKHYYID